MLKRPEGVANSALLWKESMVPALQLGPSPQRSKDELHKAAGLKVGNFSLRLQTSFSYLSKFDLKIATLPPISHFPMPPLALTSFIFLLSSGLCFQSDTSKL